MESNILLLFICGMVLTTALEYFTAYLLEVIFKATWWDYSYKKFNIKGRICLDISIAWGILSVFMIEFAVPFIDIIIGSIPPLIGQTVAVIIILFIALDVVLTANSIFSFKKLLIRLEEVKADIKGEIDGFSEKFSENLREYIDFPELYGKFRELNIKTEELKEKFERKRQIFRDLTKDEFKGRLEGRDFTEEKLETINRIKDMYARYEAIKRLKISKTHKRILSAYPGFKMKNDEFREILKNIKDRFKK